MSTTPIDLISRLAEKYLNEIAVADAGKLHSIIVDARADIQLSAEEIDEIQQAGCNRYARLNAQAVGAQKARWP
jgi:hypothetical protein